MANLKKQITLVFLGIFLLIKISPAYFQVQDLASFVEAMHILASRSFAAPDHGDHLVRIDKGIVETDTVKFVPEIKFSGVLFALIFIGSSLVAILKYKKADVFNYGRLQAGKYILLGNLRL